MLLSVADSWWQQLSDEEIRTIWLYELEAMLPSFDRSWVCDFRVHRERYVEPLHRLDGKDHIPSIKTPVENLYLATTAQIYPELASGESVTRHARRAAHIILDEQYSPYHSQRGQPSHIADNERVVA